MRRLRTRAVPKRAHCRHFWPFTTPSPPPTITSMLSETPAAVSVVVADKSALPSPFTAVASALRFAHDSAGVPSGACVAALAVAAAASSAPLLVQLRRGSLLSLHAAPLRAAYDDKMKAIPRILPSLEVLRQAQALAAERDAALEQLLPGLSLHQQHLQLLTWRPLALLLLLHATAYAGVVLYCQACPGEGFLWIPALTRPDSSGICPVAIAGCGALLLSRLFSPAEIARMDARTRTLTQAACLVGLPAAAYAATFVPAYLQLYLAATAGATLLLQAGISHPTARQRLNLPADPQPPVPSRARASKPASSGTSAAAASNADGGSGTKSSPKRSEGDR